MLGAYRYEVERIISGTGAEIHETGILGATNALSDFSYGYTWHNTDGIVRVYSFAGTNRELQVILFCYEHRK